MFDFQWPAVVWLTAWAAWPGGSNLRDSGFRQQPHHAGHTKGIMLLPSLLLGGAFLAGASWLDGPAAQNRPLALGLGIVLMGQRAC